MSRYTDAKLLNLVLNAVTLMQLATTGLAQTQGKSFMSTVTASHML